MGLPACRITDQTEHGGVIILGFPQVLIGMMPASRITDMHTCPMVTGVVPHVGGPFILGSPTVLVGMMPQSRVTDQLVCVGPPDAAILGEETVLVGMAGAAGAAGASSGAAAAGVSSAAAPPAAAATAAAAPKATAQADGTTRTSAAPGQALPAVTLQQPGWPDLPPENTATFESVQPATVLPGTTLYATGDADADASNTYWGTDPPAAEEATDSAAPTDGWNSGSHVQVATVSQGEGVKVWAGKPARARNLRDKDLHKDRPEKASGMQIWTPAKSMKDADKKRFRMPGARP